VSAPASTAFSPNLNSGEPATDTAYFLLFISKYVVDIGILYFFYKNKHILFLKFMMNVLKLNFLAFLIKNQIQKSGMQPK
jgi:hypothetical protein